MSAPGWKRLLAGAPWFRGEGTYPIAAYSEFLPPPRLGRRPYGSLDRHLFSGDDPWGWHVTEYEEFFELQPGMEAIARQIIDALVHLAEGRPAEGISKSILQGNRYWPPELAEKAGTLQHERYVTLAPLALSRTQDDQGRVRWTFFGGSEQGPGRAFWRSFYAGPGVEVSEEEGIGFIRRLLHAAYGVPIEKLADLRGAGFQDPPSRRSDVPSLWRGRTPAGVDGAFPMGRESICRTGQLPAHVSSFRSSSRSRPPRILRGETPPAALPGKPSLLGSGILYPAAARVSHGPADSPVASGRAPRRSPRAARSPVGLASRIRGMSTRTARSITGPFGKRTNGHTAGSACIATTTRCCSRKSRRNWSMSSSATCPPTWDCTTSRWRETSRSGPRIIVSCSTDRVPRGTGSSGPSMPSRRAVCSVTGFSFRRCGLAPRRFTGIARWSPIGPGRREIPPCFPALRWDISRLTGPRNRTWHDRSSFGPGSCGASFT